MLSNLVILPFPLYVIVRATVLLTLLSEFYRISFLCDLYKFPYISFSMPYDQIEPPINQLIAPGSKILEDVWEK